MRFTEKPLHRIDCLPPKFEPRRRRVAGKYSVLAIDALGKIAEHEDPAELAEFRALANDHGWLSKREAAERDLSWDQQRKLSPNQRATALIARLVKLRRSAVKDKLITAEWLDWLRLWLVSGDVDGINAIFESYALPSDLPRETALLLLVLTRRDRECFQARRLFVDRLRRSLEAEDNWSREQVEQTLKGLIE